MAPVAPVKTTVGMIRRFSSGIDRCLPRIAARALASPVSATICCRNGRYSPLAVIVSAHDGYPRHLRSGADFIEVDVRRNADGVIVLAHDDLKPGRAYPTYDELLAALPPDMGLHIDLKETGFELELMK